MRHIIPISGKDSLTTALLQTAYRPDLPYEFVFNDTGCELPETYEWLAMVEESQGWQIQRIGQSLEEIINGRNGYLPGGRTRYCTIEAKIQPFEKWLGNTPATVYYGLRADENRTGYVPFEGSMITPAYPLRAKADGGITPNGIDLKGVYTILQAKNLLPPAFFCPDLCKAVSDRLSDVVGWEDALELWQKRSLFSWRSRGNCYLCFYQQMFEILGLLKYHPDLFWRMASFEKEASDRPSAKRARKGPRYQQTSLLVIEKTPKNYTWKDGLSLKEFASNTALQSSVFNKRVGEVVDQIMAIVQARSLGILASVQLIDDMSGTSCGLICGK